MSLATQPDYLSDYSKTRMRQEMWVRALRDIFYFIENYVPKELFDLRRAAPQQIALFRAVMEGKRYFVIRAPRKGGKTICVAIIAVWLTLRNQKYRVFIVSGSEQQAEWLYKYCRRILWPLGPESAWKREFFSQFLVREPMTTITEYKEGGFIMYSAASSKAVNAPTADCQVADEFVLIPTDIVEEAFPMVRGSEDIRRFILSTATPNKENTEVFLDLLDEAGEAGSRWVRIEWEDKDCYFRGSKIAEEDAEVAKAILSPEMYETQYQGLLPMKAGRIFPRTFIREAFVALDPKRPGYLLDGSPYGIANPKPFGITDYKNENLVFQGEAKGGIDWGFDHDTVFIEGYRGLDRKIHVMKMVVDYGASPSEWADVAEDDSLRHDIQEWNADASGAFQNKEVRNRGLRVVSRAFQHMTQGKEWMIGILYYWFQRRMLVIPGTEEFEGLKKQLLGYRRGQDGKPKKGNDDKVDSLMCFASGWNPIYTETPPHPQPVLVDAASPRSANDWDSFSSGETPWMPSTWANRKGELTKQPWEK